MDISLDGGGGGIYDLLDFYLEGGGFMIRWVF